MVATDTTEHENALRRLHRKINPCETPGCSGNCAYAWSCHNTRLGKVGFFWPGIALILPGIALILIVAATVILR